MLNPQETIAKLRKHAAGTGPEAEIAKKVLADLGVSQDEIEIIDLDCPTDGGWHHRQLFCTICEYLSVDSLQYKGRPRLMIVRGPKAMCFAALSLFNHMKTTLAELHRGTTTGFLHGALPLPPKGGGKEGKPLSEDALEAARAAINIGVRNNPRHQLKG